MIVVALDPVGRSAKPVPSWLWALAAARRRAAALRRRALHEVRTAAEHSTGERGSGERTARRVHRRTRLQHAVAVAARRSLAAVAAADCRSATRCQVHQRSLPLATHAALAPRPVAAAWTPAVRGRRRAVSFPLSMTSEPGRSGSCLESRRAWITDPTRSDAQASWSCLA